MGVGLLPLAGGPAMVAAVGGAAVAAAAAGASGALEAARPCRTRSITPRASFGADRAMLVILLQQGIGDYQFESTSGERALRCRVRATTKQLMVSSYGDTVN